MVGNVGCAAMSCHGADVSRGSLGGEHHTFGQFDPHRNAYRVLFQERSVRMVKLLAEGKPHPPAHETPSCLKCHGAAAPNVARDPEPTSILHHGGQCENCHGAAGDWQTQHYLPFWKTLSPREKSDKYGFVHTDSLVSRAEMCAGCHVGTTDREVNHRLIAAGHPALRWELAAGHAEPIYVKHWTDQGYGRDLEAWTWLIGQAANARAFAKLSAHRAEQTLQPASQRDWPELAEYACYSCHQDLTAAATRVERKPKLGSLPWGSWHFALSTNLTPLDRIEQPRTIGQLTDLFAETDRPNPADAAASAHAAISSLDDLLADLQRQAEQGARQPLTKSQLRRAFRHVATQGAQASSRGATSTRWDTATQSILGATALYRTMITLDPQSRDRESEQLLRELARGLTFPAGQDSPARPTPSSYARVQNLWNQLLTRLTTGDSP
jgi:hypothetical protein